MKPVLVGLGVVLTLLVACDGAPEASGPTRTQGAGTAHKPRAESPAIRAAEAPGTAVAIPQPTASRVGPTRAEDELVRQRVQQTLGADERLSRARVQVVVASGVVTLDGQVGDVAYAERAQQIAGETPGVTSVTNQIVVRQQVPERRR